MATYWQLIQAREVLDGLAEVKLPPRFSLKLGRTTRALYEALKVFDGVRDDLVKAYGKHDEKGARVVGDDGPEWEDEESFTKEMQEALDTDAEAEFNPILLKHFPKAIELTAVEALKLEDAGIVKGD